MELSVLSVVAKKLRNIWDMPLLRKRFFNETREKCWLIVFLADLAL